MLCDTNHLILVSLEMAVAPAGHRDRRFLPLAILWDRPALHKLAREFPVMENQNARSVLRDRNICPSVIHREYVPGQCVRQLLIRAVNVKANLLFRICHVERDINGLPLAAAHKDELLVFNHGVFEISVLQRGQGTPGTAERFKKCAQRLVSVRN